MSKIPKIKGLDDLFASGKTFELTESQYEMKTGAPFPKDPIYLRNRSAIAKRARQNGYEIEVTEVIEKKVICRKK